MRRNPPNKFSLVFLIVVLHGGLRQKTPNPPYKITKRKGVLFSSSTKYVKFLPMLYYLLKILHIISAILLLFGMVNSFRLWRDHAASALIQKQTWLFILPAAFFQLLTGFTMISLEQVDMAQLWVRGSVSCFIIVIVCWFGFLLSNHRGLQSILLTLCGANLLSMIFLMANKI